MDNQNIELLINRENIHFVTSHIHEPKTDHHEVTHPVFTAFKKELKVHGRFGGSWLLSQTT